MLVTTIAFWKNIYSDFKKEVSNENKRSRIIIDLYKKDTGRDKGKGKMNVN